MRRHSIGADKDLFNVTSTNSTCDILFNDFVALQLSDTDTLKAHKNQILVQTASDFGTIDSTKEYFIDGIIDMGTTTIEVPAGGINIAGYNFDLSGLTSTENSYTLFTSAVGGCGDILLMDVAITTSGTGSQVYNCTDVDGTHAYEISRVNFNGCTSLGTLDGFRQGFESGTGRFGGKPELTLKNPWAGGYFIDSSIVRGLTDGSYSLFKAGTGFTMESRFRSNQNVDLPASASFIDFTGSNFTNPSTLQLTGMIITRAGVSDASDANLTPNITAANLASQWVVNTGLENTFEGGQLVITTEVTTTVVAANTFYDLAGTYTASDLQHFDEPSNGQLRHLGDSPLDYQLNGQLVIESDANDEVELKIVIFRDATTSFEDAKSTIRVIDRLQGARNVAYFVLIDNIQLNKNDYVKLQVANVSSPDSTANITVELDSFIIIEKR